VCSRASCVAAWRGEHGGGVVAWCCSRVGSDGSSVDPGRARCCLNVIWSGTAWDLVNVGYRLCVRRSGVFLFFFYGIDGRFFFQTTKAAAWGFWAACCTAEAVNHDGFLRDVSCVCLRGRRGGTSTGIFQEDQ